MRVIGQDEVRARLTYEVCIPIVRQAMIALSRGETRQLLRTIIPLAQGRMFGVMPGALGERAAFGAKLVSVFPENFAQGRQSHQGVVVLFDGASGAPICVAHAGEITAIRTAAASAVATDALARPEAHRLAILGYGEQAHTHIRAIAQVRKLTEVRVWGRDLARAHAFSTAMTIETGLEVTAFAEARTAVEDADIICTLTSAKTPILQGAWVAPGTHLNLVGSSYAGPVEVDHDLVVGARLIADSREGVLAQGAEVLAAKAAGLIDDSHVVGEIGEVLDGRLEGRQSTAQITVYKSLGHVVQDLASAQALMESSPS
ncbi:MAG: ornithine cyclodeaminase family protein [Phenylobacterium sp.]|uniref:ornithine cyclodeaminase family protein n=1 Tax=Phenylobacterium sp. TaxID=1871053 RepID=UPI0025FAF198|nr:ornithine cyclodeaminase family protein [Phenylobacterium sp.]MCG9917485.1 ornithine cyclodeaminase family protein [Phenylobacterium sp.]